MRKVVKWALVVAVTGLMAAPSLAQNQQRQRQGGGRGAGGGAGLGQMALLLNKDVQQDLKMTDDQVKKVTALSEKQKEARAASRTLDPQEARTKGQELAKETQKTVDETLKPEQKKRLQQLTMQQQGIAFAANNPEVAKTLNITDDQKSKMREIQMESFQKMRDIRQAAGDNREEANKKLAEFRKETNGKIEGVLTADQKAKWKEMAGEPFKGTLPTIGGAVGRRPGGGRGAPPPGK